MAVLSGEPGRKWALVRAWRALPPNRRVAPPPGRTRGRLTWPARLERAAIALVAVLAALALAAPLGAPALLGALGRGLGLEIRAAAAEISWLDGRLDLRDVVVCKRLSADPSDEPDTLLEAGALRARFDLGALFRNEVRIRSIEAQGPRVRLEIGPDGRSTIERIIAEAPWLEGPAEPGGPRVILDALEIERARVEFQDLASEPSLYIDGAFDLRLEFGGGDGLSFRGRAGIGGLVRALEASGRIRPRTGGALALEASARGEGLSLAFLNPYLPGSFAAELEDGRLELAASVTVAPAGAGVSLEADVARLRIDEGGRTLASLGGLALRASRLDEAARTWAVERAALRDLFLEAERDAAGVVHAAGFAAGNLEAIGRARARLAPGLRRTYERLFSLGAPRGARRPEPAAAPHPAGTARPDLPEIRLDELAIDGAVIEWRDAAVATPPIETALRVPRVRIERFRFPETSVEPARYSVQLSLDRVLRSLEMAGRADPFGVQRSVTVTARVDGLALDLLEPYWRGTGVAPAIHDGRVELEARATIEDLGRGSYAVEMALGPTALYDGTVVVVALGALELRVPLVDLRARRLEIERATITDAAARLRRRVDGRIETLGVVTAGRSLWPRPGALAAGKDEERGRDLDRERAPGPDSERAPEPDADRPWTIAIGDARLEGGWLEVRDDVPAVPVSTLVDVRAASVAGLVLPDTPSAASYSVELGLMNVIDRLTVRGLLKPRGRERALTVALRLDGFRPEQLAPYRPQDFPIVVRNAGMTADAAVRLEEIAPGAFRGEATLARLAVREGPALLAGMEELRLHVVRVAPAERTYIFDEVEALAPELRVARRADGRIELFGWTSRAALDILRRGAREAAAPPVPATGAGDIAGEPRPDPALPLVAIGRLRIADGRVEIRDDGVAPASRLDLEEVDLLSRGITTAALRGDVRMPPSTPFSLRLAVAETIGRLHVEGAVVLKPRFEGELQLEARNVRLPRLSPWVHAASGVSFESGSARVEGQVSLDARRFESSFRVVARDLALGGEAARARSLPGAGPVTLEMAATLLRDERGVIDLTIPISGERGQPSIAVLRLIGIGVTKTMSSALKKVFRPIVRGIFGTSHAGELRFAPVEFARGSAAIAPAAALALDEAARALCEAKATVELRGGADPATDLPAPLYFRATLDPTTIDREEPRSLAATRARLCELAAVEPGVDRVILKGGRGRISGSLVSATGAMITIAARAVKDPVSVRADDVLWLSLGTERGREIARGSLATRPLLARQESLIRELERDIAAGEAELARARALFPAELDEAVRAARREARDRLRRLGLERAAAVRAHLLARGVRSERVRLGDPLERGLLLPVAEAGAAAADPWTDGAGLRRVEIETVAQ